MSCSLSKCSFGSKKSRSKKREVHIIEKKNKRIRKISKRSKRPKKSKKMRNHFGNDSDSDSFGLLKLLGDTVKKTVHANSENMNALKQLIKDEKYNETKFLKDKLIRESINYGNIRGWVNNPVNHIDDGEKMISRTMAIPIGSSPVNSPMNIPISPRFVGRPPVVYPYGIRGATPYRTRGVPLRRLYFGHEALPEYKKIRNAYNDVSMGVLTPMDLDH